MKNWFKNNYKKIVKIFVILVCFYLISFLCKQVQPYILETFNTTQSKILLWLFTVLLSGIIPGPFMPLVIFCSNTNLFLCDNIKELFYWQSFQNILLIWSAVVVGKAVSYILGNKLGIKCTKWIITSEEEYNNWSNKINRPKGLLFYCITVALPFFPDFLLSYIAGSLKLNFKVYILINSICKFVDIVVVLLLLKSNIL